MAPENGPVIQVENLTKTYQLERQEVRALRGVSFAIMPSEFVAIMGPSGSGKSTLMNLIGCLDTPSEGTYLLNGKLVSSMGEDELATVRNKDIGFIFQVFNLLPRATAFRNVELPMIYAGARKTEREARARRALEMVEMKDRMLHKPSELSGGERQRVAIARALVNDPALLLADEPTGNLDSKSGEEIMAMLSDLWKNGRTIIMVTHNDAVAARSERIVGLFDGMVK